MAIINGTGGDDTLVGTGGADTINGGDGSDVIHGMGGNDRLFSGPAPYPLGVDWVFGGAGNDELNGDTGRQFLLGGIGSDTLYGLSDTDFLFHHGGDTNSARTPGPVLFFGQNFGPLGFTFDPYAEDYAVDRLYGGEWSDFVFVGLGDIADGGIDTDVVVVSLIGRTNGITYTQQANWQSQLSTLIGGSLTNFEGYYLRATDYADQLTGVGYVAAGRGADTITGTGFDDQIATSGWCFTDDVTGSLGALADDGDADYVDAGLGNDIIHAGLNDRIYGGAGSDAVYVSLVRATSGVNIDLSSGDLASLAEAMNGVLDGIEYLYGVYLTDYNDVFVARPGTAVGSSNIRIYGGGGNDVLSGTGYTDFLDGGTGDDVLDGGRGNDRMYGGLGNDTFYVDIQQDLVFENADEGMDIVYASSSFYLYDNIETLILTGTGNTFGVGNALDNQITGNDRNNLLLGGDGSDVIFGQAGNDNLFGEAGNDSLYGGAGIDYLVGGAGHDALFGEAGADALYGQDGDDVLWGGATFDTDILVGGAGNDILRGDSGLADYDLLDGDAGDDIYWVDTGDDLTFEDVGGGNDTVYADVKVANAGVYLYDNVENLVLV
ncbi:MAG: calcium-binding protein, partial [Brevundimonas sp.]|uniref:calcium-binding protein n=1 Tax=Brevundimonas sp. TaxID=1871086 RepID=UPI003002AFD7